jgi:hypothetical protein
MDTKPFRESMPIENLKDLVHFDSIVLCHTQSVQPERDILDSYIQKKCLTSWMILLNSWYLGRMVEFIKKEELSDRISILIQSRN